ncbi:MAG TPA: homocysteine S-methyltransferase family protein, partial [Planctomycetota bacterium]|nr:homocysteine S-methyltransferase family protein [Planctomycetota bacterium]
MKRLGKRLAQKRLLIADGAWGTELVRRGLEPGVPPERWNLERPDDVRAVAADYVAAGADIVLTNSFGGSPIKLAKSGLAHEASEINRLAARLSKDAAGDRALVFASIGPTGEFLAPLGTLSEEDAVAAFAVQVKAFVAGGADGVVVESMSDLVEAKAGLRAVRENSDLEVVVTLT